MYIQRSSKLTVTLVPNSLPESIRSVSGMVNKFDNMNEGELGNL